MANDNELLREYARSASEAAFAELVNRHVNMVYSAALREVDGDVHSAQELTQLVFVELGRKAASLVRHPALAGWLYTCVRWMAANARRAEDRRRRRQLEYQTMSQLHPPESPESTWQQVRPVLDDTLHELGEKDRAAIVLRFFENLSLKEVGTQLGLNENAARMRVDRALERLHALLSKRGITSARSALAAALVAGALVAAPAGLAASIATTAIAPPAAATAATTGFRLLKSTVATKSLVLVGTALVFVLGTMGTIHFVRSHPALLLQLHQWFMQ
jgi:RNA polymerase sigma factor (sigma-70 family)